MSRDPEWLRVHRELEYLRAVGAVHKHRRYKKKKAVMDHLKARVKERRQKLDETP